MLPIELLNLLHQAESESKYTQFITNKLLENTNLRESEKTILKRIQRVLSHKEGSRRFQVLSVSLRRVVSLSYLTLSVVFFLKCRFYLFSFESSSGEGSHTGERLKLTVYLYFLR